MEQRTMRIVVVRPYRARMRSRVFAALEQAGLKMDGATEIPQGTPDDETRERIVQADPDVLLVPFHAHRDAQGNRLDGLTLCRLLHETATAPSAPVLMPVTRMAMASLRLMSVSGPHAALHRTLLDGKILTLADDEVDLAPTPARIMAHLRRHGVR